MKEMKIVKNYKKLKKWAKTLFVTLLTICIVFTSTGVATLFAYADPADENNESHEHSFTSTEYESNNDGTHKVIKKCECDYVEESSEDCLLIDGVCQYCDYSSPIHVNNDDHEHVYTTRYESNNDGTHKAIKSDEYGDISEIEENCVIVNGACPDCGYIDLNQFENEPEDSTSLTKNTNNKNDLNESNLSNTRGILRGSMNAPAKPEKIGTSSQFGSSFTSYPSGGRTLEYNKSEQVLFDAGVAKENFQRGNGTATYTVLGVYYFVYKKTGSNTYSYLGQEDQFSQTDIGEYCMMAVVNLSGPNSSTETHSDLYDSQITKGNIATKSTTPASPATYSTYRTAGGFTITGLDKDVDYTVDASQLPSAPIANCSYNVILTGIGNYEGTVIASVEIEDITCKFDGVDLHTAAYNEQVVISATGYNLSYSEAGPFDGSITYTEPGDNQSVTLYFQDNNGNVIKKTIEGLNVKTSIPIKFNGNTEKKDSYVEKVDITADGYTIGTSASGPFSAKYTHKTLGENQVIELYFRSDQTGTIKLKTITGITILPKDATAIGESTGKIIIGDYSSDKIAATEKTVYSTRDSKSIEIQATNEKSGIASIEYATSNEAYNTVSDILGAVIDKKMNWKPYSNDGKPTFPKDSALYVYARITDNDGNYNYLSTGKIIHDTVDPQITNAILAAKEDGSNENVLVITAKDTLSGIGKFYMLYEPKNEDSKTPEKDELIKKGNTSSVDASDGENFGGSYKLSDLIEDTTYIFYIIAEDEVGNISEIKTIESKGKGSGSAKGSGNSSNQSSPGSGSGLTPAPNGIAGSGNTKTPKTGITNIPQKTPQEEKESPLDREINRVPYISDATGDTKIGIAETGGWDKITNEVKNAAPGISMDVEMSGFSVVPDKVFKTMMGKNLNVKFLMPEDVEWIINGENIKSTSGTDIDMGVRIGAKNIPNDMLNAVIGTYPHTEIELKHDGNFGFSGILRIPLGESNAGAYAYLYYYDTKTKEMKLMQSTHISSTGYAEFAFNHASDYSIVIRSEEMQTVGTVKSNDTLDGGDTKVDKTSAYKTFRLTDFAGSKASVRMWLFMIAIISAVMCGLILYMPGLKDEEAVEEI